MPLSIVKLFWNSVIICFVSPLLSTAATAWRYRCDVRTGWPCLRYRNLRRNVCPAGTGNQPSASYISPTNPVEKIIVKDFKTWVSRYCRVILLRMYTIRGREPGVVHETLNDCKARNVHWLLWSIWEMDLNPSASEKWLNECQPKNYGQIYE